MGSVTVSRWSHLYLDTKLPWDTGMRVGRFSVDIEGDNGLYIDNDAIFGDFYVDGFRFVKGFGPLNLTAVAGRNSDFREYDADSSYMNYVLDLNFTPGERFFAGATAYLFLGDEAKDKDIKTYGAYAGYNVTPNIGIKGAYYHQDKDDETSNAWRAALEVKQEALKFTSLWLEYC